MLIQEDYWCNPLRHDWWNVLWIQKIWDGNYIQLGPLEVWRSVYLVRTYCCLLYISMYYCFLIQRLACTSTSLLWEDSTAALTFIKMLTDLSLQSQFFTPFFFFMHTVQFFSVLGNTNSTLGLEFWHMQRSNSSPGKFSHCSEEWEKE